jgi:hypothetical protein
LSLAARHSASSEVAPTVGNEAAELPFKPFFGIIFRGFFLLAKGRLDVNFGNLLALGQRGGVSGGSSGHSVISPRLHW